MDVLTGHLVNANNEADPADVGHYLALCLSDAQKCIEKIDMIDNSAQKDKDGVVLPNFRQHEDLGNTLERNQEMIDTFMFTAQTISDNYPEHQDTVLEILALLSVIKFDDFGVSCFNALRDLMKASQKMKEKVLDVIEEEIIIQIKEPDPIDLPAGLLEGLNEVVEEEENPEILTRMYDTNFKNWLVLMCEEIEIKK